ncbi:MAG: N,N-dimethylformamidase beta subunit family domain-containing protein, partial [Gaiellaceae bacterium]
VGLVVGTTARPVHHRIASAGAFPIGDDDGRDAVQPDSKRPKIEATFTRESYRAGDLARLDLWSSARGVSVRIWRAGTQPVKIVANDLMDGNPVSQPVSLGAVADGRTVRLRIGDWPSGLYFARLDGDGGKIGFAPFVLAPTRLGEHRVAVVLPTMTWQAYNFRDEDHDGKGDTWYANWKHLQAHLFRPYLNRGVPNHYKAYDDPFQRWLYATHREVDQLSDGDLNTLGSAAALRKAYDLIVFPGHHEYVTTHEYDLIQRYRDLGGNLMFLSANNFFWRVDRRGNTIHRIAKWRDLGRPEAALIGVQYIGNDDGSHRGPWLVRKSSAPASWVFRGTQIAVGDGFGNGGIEADATSPASPRDVRVLAEIPDLFAPGFTAQMSYYVGPHGSQVFAAGAFTLAGAIWDEQVQQIVTNVWDRMTGTV